MDSRLRAIFFDAGNTLIFPRVEELAQDLTAQGFPATEEDFCAAECAGKRKLDEWLWPQIRRGEVPRTPDHFYWRKYLQALMQRIRAPQEEHKRLMGALAETFSDIKLWSRVFPETSPFLERLRSQGYLLGVISNSGGLIEEQLGRLSLARHFDAVLDSAIVGVAKPHPGIFQIALARAGVEASDALFVGDTYSTDIGGAQLASVRGVLFDRVGAYPDADCPRITSLPEMEGLLGTM